MASSEVRLQNMMMLCKELRLPVAYKVLEVLTDEGTEESNRSFMVVVHVLSDHAFKKYLQHCSLSDMLLFRGLLLNVCTTPAVDRIITATVQQAFLPKFENEGQDASIADAIVSSADSRYMVVTIKHSGSLVTLSSAGFAAKNSVNNEYTAGAAALLQAHFERSAHTRAAGGDGDASAFASQRLKSFMQVLAARRIAISFEMVTGRHGHHGQLPQGEYLVTTSAHTMDDHGNPSFLPWRSFLAFCIEMGLPMNDTWLVAGPSWANAVRDTLDELALSGGPTKRALRALGKIVQDGSASGCVHLPGTYPHEDWQGSRIEGFVIAQGEEVTQDAAQLLEQLRPAMQAAVLPLAAIPEQLRQPYRDSLAGAKGDPEPWRSTMQSASWLPAPKLQSVTGTQRDALVSALVKGTFHSASSTVPADPNTSQQYAQYMTVSSTGGVLCSRKAMQDCSAEQMLELVSVALSQKGAGGTDLLEVAKSLLVADMESATGEELMGMPSDTTRVKVIQALSGAADTGGTALRYKKKMSMWSRSEGDEPAEMGYCMMTFVIRNGLQALGLGIPTYMGYVDNLIRNWGLPKQHGGQVRMFARAWASWFGAHGGLASIPSATYLDAAEPFVKAFIAAGCQAGANGSLGAATSRPQDAFQGMLVLVDVPAALAEALKRSLNVQTVLDCGGGSAVAAELPNFSKSMITQGSIVLMASDNPSPKSLRTLLGCCGAHIYALVKRASLPEGCDPNSVPAKKLRGLHHSKVKVIETAIQGSSKDLKISSALVVSRIVYLPEDGAGNVDDIKAWLGAGAALPESDPAVICSFVALPGIGKTVLTDGLDVAGLPNVAGRISLKVLSGDRMKKTIKNYATNRYWHEVAAAADTQVGGGSVTVVVADKNLVPSPPGNIERVLNILKDTGAASVAVVPTCVGGSNSLQLCPGLYQGLPDLPFPLEMVALCMLRTLQRKQHEGGLDASLPECLAVLCKFADFFRNSTRDLLMQRLGSCFSSVVQLPVMTLPEGGEELQVPEALLRHIAAGVASGGEVPDGWEARCRQLLLQPDTSARILALQRPLDAVRSELQSSLATSLAALAPGTGDTVASSTNTLAQPSISTALATLLPGSLEDAAAEEGGPGAQPPRPRFVAVAGFDVAPLVQAAQAILPADIALKFKSELHVTLWHADDPLLGPDSELLEQLLSCVGQEVVVEVMAIDYSPNITAAQVQLLSGPESCYAKKEYLHITLSVAPNGLAKDSNLLPGMLKEGTATRVLITDGHLQLTGGQILGFLRD